MSFQFPPPKLYICKVLHWQSGMFSAAPSSRLGRPPRSAAPPSVLYVAASSAPSSRPPAAPPFSSRVASSLPPASPPHPAGAVCSPKVYGTGYGFAGLLFASLRARSPASSSRFRGLTTVLNFYNLNDL